MAVIVPVVVVVVLLKLVADCVAREFRRPESAVAVIVQVVVSVVPLKLVADGVGPCLY